MGDYASWGESIAQALGYRPGEFIRHYAQNVATQNEAAIDASPVGQAIIAFMEGRSEWAASPTELLNCLQEVAESLKLNIKGKKWPKEPSWLWRRIKEIRPNLLALGIEARNGTEDKVRTIVLTRAISENGDDAVDGTGADTKPDETDDSSDSMATREEDAVGAGQIRNDSTGGIDSISLPLSQSEDYLEV